MTIYSKFLKDPSGNISIISKTPSNVDDYKNAIPLYGISGEAYIIKTVLIDNISQSFMGYGPSMCFFTASGEEIYLDGIYSKENMQKYNIIQ